MSATLVAVAPSEVRAGAVIGESFREYRRQWKRLIPAALVLALGTSLVGLVLQVVFEGSLGELGAAVVAVLTVFLLPIWLQAMDLQERADVRAGEEESTLGEAIAQLRPTMLRLVGASLLVSLGVLVGLLLLIVPGFILSARWSQIAPAIVVERRGVFDALRRSNELVRGRTGAVIGAFLLNTLIILPLYLALIIGFQLAMSTEFGSFFQTLAVETLVAPFSALVLTTLYFRLARVPEAEAASPGAAERSFSRERRLPAMAGRVLVFLGAALAPIAFALDPGYWQWETTDLLTTELAVASMCLVVISLFSRTRLPLLGTTVAGFFLLGQWFPEGEYFDDLSRGGYFLLGAGILMCTGSTWALLARPARGPRLFG